MANNKKCSFQKMGTKRVARPKKKNALTPKERMRMIQKKMKEFRKWYG
jgi:hypothetical protein